MTVKQILLVSTLRNVWRTVWRICILMLGCEGVKWIPRKPTTITDGMKKIIFISGANIDNSWTYNLKKTLFHLLKKIKWIDEIYLEQKTLLNPLTPKCDQDRISLYNNNTKLRRQVVRIKKNVNWRIISWSNSKFSELIS